jgi:hypothetical protein
VPPCLSLKNYHQDTVPDSYDMVTQPDNLLNKLIGVLMKPFIMSQKLY